MQGILAAPNLPAGACPDRLRPFADRFRAEAARRGRSGAGLALAYARSIHDVSGLVLGAETLGQVRENAAMFEDEPLTVDERLALDAAVGTPPDDLVDISGWAAFQAASADASADADPGREAR